MPEFRGGTWELIKGEPYYEGGYLPHIVRDFKARLALPVTQSFPTVIYATNAWKTDGSEIGRSVDFGTFQYAISNNPYDNRIQGSMYMHQDSSGDYVYDAYYEFPAGFFPIIPSPYYPTPIVNANGGVKFQPVNPNLPKTLALPDVVKSAGFATEVYFTVEDIDSLRRRLTITGLDFNQDCYVLSLDESDIGDGSAYAQNYNVAHPGNRPVIRTYYAWRLSYKAAWVLYNPGSIVGFSNGMGCIGFSVPRNISAGAYKLSDIYAANNSVFYNGGFAFYNNHSAHYSI